MEVCLPGFEVKVKMPERLEPDLVNHPPHYCVGGLECFDVMKHVFGVEAVKIFCRLNSFKYLFRSENKNGEQDIAKDNWYTAKYLELCKEQPKTPDGLAPDRRAAIVAAVDNLIDCAEAWGSLDEERDEEAYNKAQDDLADAMAEVYHLFGAKTNWELAEEAKKAKGGE